MDMTRYFACHQQWIAGQEAGLGELTAAAANAAARRATEAELRAVVERCLRGYEEYATTRRAMAPEDGAAFFAPPWCTTFEKAVLWLGGCRPSLSIRLLYCVSSEGLEAQLQEFLSGHGRAGGDDMIRPTGSGLLGINAMQLEQINNLHGRTIHEEGILSERLASLQEKIADRPLLPIVREREQERARAAALPRGSASSNGLVGRFAAMGLAGVDAEVDAAMESYTAGLAKLLEEADQLRLSTTRELATEILTPRQAVEMLAAAKQLHLSICDWSRRKEGAQSALLPPAATASSSSSGRPNA
ncbi:protein DOG1-like 3 [Brachypodium distachyon]|uniref:DOG1 domain-containing protein n=1 Tax=Brachypodium distachyon TaxID=15368 RepID=I1GZ94_BRADI|nr:protein DOG1-like 3 [Brachypodium distachyon]KQK18712.1 hypothetical protein BRADI_1g44237v3 [Brachypodium distachyon]|eukprot:XP_003560850.1 protein DOG1-like 3 [Brachypodium distachyon]